MVCKDDSEPPDETDFPDAGHDDMADYIETYIETRDTDTAIEEEMHGDIQTSEDGRYNNSPHTTTNRTNSSVEQPQHTLA